MAETVLEPVFVTNTSFFPESYAAPNGALPTFIVATTVLLESDITDTLFEPSFVTNTSFFPESYAAPNGALPTVIVAIRALIESDMTGTIFTLPGWKPTKEYITGRT